MQGWNFGRFLVLLGSRRLYSLSGKYSPNIPFSYRTRSPWNSEHSTSSTVPHRITHRQTHGITTKAYSFNDVKYTVFSIYLIRNHEHIANITYSPSIIYSLGPETKLGIPTLVKCPCPEQGRNPNSQLQSAMVAPILPTKPDNHD